MKGFFTWTALIIITTILAIFTIRIPFPFFIKMFVLLIEIGIVIYGSFKLKDSFAKNVENEALKQNFNKKLSEIKNEQI